MKKTILIGALICVASVNMNAQETKKEVAKDHREEAKIVRKEKKALKKIDKSEVPAGVLTVFNTGNPNVQIVEWSAYPSYFEPDAALASDSTYTLVEYYYPEFYEVEYVKDSKTNKSVYSRGGKLLHTRRFIKEEELPKKVTDALKNSVYKDWKIVGSKEKIERQDPKETEYKITVENGKEKHVLFYNEEGKLVQGKKIKL
jgi:hypothetical protein